MSEKELSILYIYGGVGLLNCEYHLGDYEDSSFYKLRYEIFNLIGRQPKVKFLVKFGYGNENLEIALEKRIFNREYPAVTAINSSNKLTDVLSLGDAYIIEKPGTTLFEVLATNRPILLFCPRNSIQLTDRAIEKLNKRILISYTAKEFLVHLTDLIENGRNSRLFTGTVPTDREFFESFVLAKNMNSPNELSKTLKSILHV